MTTRTWLPEDYLDETVPPGRSDPTDWIKGPGQDGTFEMAPAFGNDDEGQPIKMKPGDIKSFYWCDPLGCVNVKVRRDGTFEVLGDVPPEATNLWCSETGVLGDDPADFAKQSLEYIDDGKTEQVFEMDMAAWANAGVPHQLVLEADGPKFKMVRAN